MFFSKKIPPKNKTPKARHKRPSFWMRLSATALDLGICFLVMKFLRWETSMHIIITFILAAIYYCVVEIMWGRTPGKIILRMKMVNTKGQKPKKVQFFWRTLLRFGGIMMMLSWNRITLLDLLSGLRIENMEANEPLTKKIDIEKIPAGWR